MCVCAGSQDIHRIRDQSTSLPAELCKQQFPVRGLKGTSSYVFCTASNMTHISHIDKYTRILYFLCHHVHANLRLFQDFSLKSDLPRALRRCTTGPSVVCLEIVWNNIVVLLPLNLPSNHPTSHILAQAWQRNQSLRHERVRGGGNVWSTTKREIRGTD